MKSAEMGIVAAQAARSIAAIARPIVRRGGRLTMSIARC